MIRRHPWCKLALRRADSPFHSLRLERQLTGRLRLFEWTTTTLTHWMAPIGHRLQHLEALKVCIWSFEHHSMLICHSSSEFWDWRWGQKRSRRVFGLLVIRWSLVCPQESSPIKPITGPGPYIEPWRPFFASYFERRVEIVQDLLLDNSIDFPFDKHSREVMNTFLLRQEMEDWKPNFSNWSYDADVTKELEPSDLVYVTEPTL